MASSEISVRMDNSKQNPTSTPDKSTGKQWWTKFLKLFCMLGVLMDPFFFYVPFVNEKEQCIRMDKALMIGMIISRAIADLPYLVQVVVTFKKELDKLEGDHQNQPPSTEATPENVRTYKRRLARILWQTSLVMDVYTIVPLLYVIVLQTYSHNNRDTSFGILQFYHFSVLLQYIPRVTRVYRLATKRSKETELVWLQMLSFSIFLFILASHVVGSFWYISSIQRLMACWKQYNCGIGNEKKCQIGTLFCDNPASRNFTSLKFSCQPSDLPNTNTTHFDYGIFLDLIQSKLVGKPNLHWPPQKLIYCFWWGLQNLSSLGQNLKTSTGVYENYFAILIFISGMVIYTVSLSGNLQLLGKLAQEKKMKRKMKIKDQEIESWLSDNKFDPHDHEDMKKMIMEYVKEELEQNRDVHMENILSILPAASEHETNISSRLRLACLKKVAELKDKDQQTLEKMCKLLRLVMYPEASYIIREGEPHDMILFIVQGLVRVHTTDERGRINSLLLKTGDIYGEEIINTTSSSDLLVTNGIVKSVTRVGAFALLAEDLNQQRPTSVQ